MPRFLLWLSLLAPLMLSSASVSAQPAASKEATALTDKARSLFNEGTAAYASGKYEEARASFLAAWALNKNWAIAANLADIETRLGKHRDAAEHAAFALKSAPPERRQAIEAFADAAAPYVATRDVRVSQPEAQVSVDGRPVGVSPLETPLFFDGGEHVVEARLGNRTARASFTATAGTKGVLDLNLVAGAGLPQPTARPLAPAIVLGGIGAAGLVTGGLLLGIASSKGSDARAAAQKVRGLGGTCDPASSSAVASSCSTFDSAASAHNTLGPLGGIALGIGAAAAAGAVLYLVWPRAETRTSSIQPWLAPNGAGLSAKF